MIKVNLLREYGAKAKKVRMPTMPASMLGIYVLVGFVLLIGGVFGAWYYLDGEIAGMSEERDRLALDAERLKKLRKEIDDSKKVKSDVEQRIEVIETLKANQTGPVQLLNSVIQAMPVNPPVWLTIVDQRADQIRLTGFAVRPEVIPDFMTALSRSGFFKSVDLEDMSEERDAARFRLILTAARRGSTN